MVKRALSSSASPGRQNKKSKPSPGTGQSRLDTFFGASSGPSLNTDRLSQPRAHRATSSNPSGSRRVVNKGEEVNHIPTDEELAWSLASADGLDLEALRKLESQRSSIHLSATTRRDSTDPEIIDVDALIEQASQNSIGPSRLSTPTPSTNPAIAISPTRNTPRSSAAQRTIGNATPSVNPIYEPLNVDPPTYDPGCTPWAPESPVPYSFLAHTLATLSSTRSRIAKLDTLTNALRTICRQHPQSLLPALYLLSNSLSPPYSPIELGLGPSIIYKAIQHVSGLSSAALKRLYNATGDPGKHRAVADLLLRTLTILACVGDVAFEAKSNVRTLIPHPPLLVTGVYSSLLKIAHAKGPGAAKTKQAIVEKLLVSARGEETRYLVRTLGQNLRVGAVRTSLAALARAMVLTPPERSPALDDSPYRVGADLLEQVKPLVAKKKVPDEARDALNEVYLRAESLIKRVYVQHPNYDHIVQALLEVGLDGLAAQLPLTVGESRSCGQIRLVFHRGTCRAGVPLLPTLGSPTRSLDEIYDRLGFLPFTAEFKYDGQRAQIHASRGENNAPFVKLFSRHLEDMTDKVGASCPLLPPVQKLR